MMTSASLNNDIEVFGLHKGAEGLRDYAVLNRVCYEAFYHTFILVRM